MNLSTVMVLVGVGVLVIAAIALLLVAIGIAGGRLGRDVAPGILRLSAIDDDAAWRAAHQAALPWLWAGALAAAAGGIATANFALQGADIASFALLATALVVVLAAFAAVRRGQRS